MRLGQRTVGPGEPVDGGVGSAPARRERSARGGLRERLGRALSALRRGADVWPVLRTVVATLAAAVALGAWAVASPVGAAPDDDFHLASLWCAPTAAAEFCEHVPGAEAGVVRAAVSSATRCFVIDESVSGACSVAALEDDRLIRTERANFDGYNPQGFYLLLGPLAGEDVAASVLLVRAVNAGLWLAVVLGAFVLVPSARRPALVWGVLVSIVPMGLYLVPSTNPQSWSFGAGAVALIAVIGAVESRGARRWLLGGLALLTSVVAVLARSDAAAVLLLTVGVVLLLRFRPTRRGWVLTAVLGVLVVVAVAGWLSSGQRGYGLLRAGFFDPDRLWLALVDTLAMPILWYRVLAGPVGWQDVPLSPVVGVIGGVLLLAAVVWALRAGDRRMRAAIALVVAALWLLPLYVLVNSGHLVGMFVQPRYIAPIVVLLGTLVLLRGPGTLRLPPWAAWSVAGLLAVAHAAALHGVLRRFATGTDVAGLDLDAGAEWWWPGAPLPMTTWVIGSLAWAVVLACAVPLVARARRAGATGLLRSGR